MFTKVLVPLDRSALAEQALGQAVAIASAAHASIDVVLVHEPLTMAGFGDAPWNAEQLDEEQKYVQTIANELAKAATIPVTYAVMRGEAVDMICKRAKDVGADLVVMTSHGRTGFSRAWLGSIADGVLRHATIPVLMLRASEAKHDRFAAVPLFQRILVPTDGSSFAGATLSSTAALARCADAKVTLLRVVQPVPLMTLDVDLATGIGSGMPFGYSPQLEDSVATEQVVKDVKEQLAEAAQRLLEREGIKADHQVVVSGQIAQAILDFAHAHDMHLIAMSTHGRGASRLLVGSVADKVIRASGLPVLLQRAVGVQEEPPHLNQAGVISQLPAMSIA